MFISCLLYNRNSGFFSASAEVVNDDELSVVQELQHSDVSDKEMDTGKIFGHYIEFDFV